MTLTTLFYLVAERLAIMERTISINFPVYDNKLSFLAWKVKFEAYVSLLKLSTSDAKKLIPLCFADRKFESVIETIDDKTTTKSLFEKLEIIINQENRPCDPLQNLMERKWENHENFYDFVRELKKRARFITKHKEAVDDLVRLQLIRTLPPALSSVISIQDEVDDIAKRISKLPRPTQSVLEIHNTEPTTAALRSRPRNEEVVCYNCDRPGHIAPKCFRKANKCSNCNKEKHLAKYCSRVSKNGK